MPPTLDRLRPSKAYDGRDLGDEYLFYDREGDKLHVLNGTAREIYLMCDGTRDAEEIAQALVDSYKLEPPVARQDTAEALLQMLELGLLEQP